LSFNLGLSERDVQGFVVEVVRGIFLDFIESSLGLLGRTEADKTLTKAGFGLLVHLNHGRYNSAQLAELFHESRVSDIISKVLEVQVLVARISVDKRARVPHLLTLTGECNPGLVNKRFRTRGDIISGCSSRRPFQLVDASLSRFW